MESEDHMLTIRRTQIMDTVAAAAISSENETSDKDAPNEILPSTAPNCTVVPKAANNTTLRKGTLFSFWHEESAEEKVEHDH
jgi:hypothetical protein